MCTNPIQIYNRSDKISYRGSALVYTVPCGQCEECKKKKHSEYLLRSYFEYLDCESKGGYVYFDTLTYSNKYLPKHFGIAHFSREDIILMLKELRVYLTRAGFDVKDKIKYFITSEYGGKTHRPHYHVLFYINVPNLDVKTFWRYLNKAWKFGFIDRQSTAPSRVVNSSAALNYVSKYVTKDQEWQNVVDAKLAKLKRLGADYKLQDKLKDFQPFHKQSQGYGANFLKYTSLDSIVKNGFITIPDKKYLVKNFAIPMYYRRKMFYTLSKEDGKLKWTLNDLGVQYKMGQLDNLISDCTQRYIDTFNNLNSYNLADDFDVDTVKKLINIYLDGRTFKDFATYLICYRYKLLSQFVKVLPDYRTMYRYSLSSGTTDSYLYNEDVQLQSSFRSRMDQMKITQYRYHEFRDFDNLYHLFRCITQYVNTGKDKHLKKIQELRDRLKLIA